MVVRELTYFESIMKTIQREHGFDTALVFYGLISEAIYQRLREHNGAVASERKVSDEFCQAFGTRCVDELKRIVRSFDETK